MSCYSQICTRFHSATRRSFQRTQLKRASWNQQFISFFSKVWGHEMKHEFQAGKSARQRRKPCDTHINTALMQSDIIVEVLRWEIRAVSPRGFSVARIRTRRSKMYERQDNVLNNSAYRREQFLYCRYVDNNDKPGKFNMRERVSRYWWILVWNTGNNKWRQSIQCVCVCVCLFPTLLFMIFFTLIWNTHMKINTPYSGDDSTPLSFYYI